MARQHPEQNLDVAAVLQHLAFAATNQGDLVKAEHFARQAVELHRNRGGEGLATSGGLIYLADSLLCQQKFDEAEACYREALAIHLKHFDDSQPPVVAWLGLAQALRGKDDQAGLDALRATIDLNSTNTGNGSDSYYRGSLFVELGDWEQAETAFVNGAALEANTDTQLYSLFYLALARLARNNQSGYRESCMSLVKQAGQSSEPNSALVAHIAARACVLAPDSFDKPDQVVLLAQRAFESNTKEPSYLATLGAALYRADRFEDARQRFAEAIEAVPIGSSELHAVTYSHLFLAMNHERLGQPEEARQWLNRAVQALDKPASLGQRRLAEYWSRHVQLQILRKEAEAVLADGKGNRATTTVPAPG